MKGQVDGERSGHVNLLVPAPALIGTLGQGAVPQNVSVMPHEDSLGCRDGLVSHTIAFAHPVVRCLRVASRVRPRQPDKRGAAAH
jgi:hypothetical protein